MAWEEILAETIAGTWKKLGRNNMPLFRHRAALRPCGQQTISYCIRDSGTGQRYVPAGNRLFLIVSVITVQGTGVRPCGQRLFLPNEIVHIHHTVAALGSLGIGELHHVLSQFGDYRP